MISGSKWDSDQDALFDELTSGGMIYADIAKIMHRSEAALKARRKARNRILFGLGPKPGGQIKPKGPDDYMLSRRELPANDDAHIRRCLDAGGFTPSRLMHGQRYFAMRATDGRVVTWKQP